MRATRGSGSLPEVAGRAGPGGRPTAGATRRRGEGPRPTRGTGRGTRSRGSGSTGCPGRSRRRTSRRGSPPRGGERPGGGPGARRRSGSPCDGGGRTPPSARIRADSALIVSSRKLTRSTRPGDPGIAFEGEGDREESDGDEDEVPREARVREDPTWVCEGSSSRGKGHREDRAASNRGADRHAFRGQFARDVHEADGRSRGHGPPEERVGGQEDRGRGGDR